MSLVDPAPSQRETPVTTTTKPEKSYTKDQPSPRVQTRGSIDSTMYPDFYPPQSPDRDSIVPVSQHNKRKSMDEAPELPQKSSLRTSRLLENLKFDDPTSPLTRSTPHDLYLSSEEDASSSADDFSDYDFEGEDDEDQTGSTSEESQNSPTRRTSHEDTARVVSVVFSGRPSIIDVSTSRRSICRISVDDEDIAARPRTSLASAFGSLSSMPRPSTSSNSVAFPFDHPPRSSSMLIPGTSRNLLGVDNATKRPQFLNTDPFPNHGVFELRSQDHTPEESATPRTPRAPRSPAAVLKSVSRTLSLVRKRSHPLLNNISAPSPLMASTPENRSTADLPIVVADHSSTPQSHHDSSTISSNNSSRIDLNGPRTPTGRGSLFPAIDPVARRATFGPTSMDGLAPTPQPAPRTPLSPMKAILAMGRRRSIHAKVGKV